MEKELETLSEKVQVELKEVDSIQQLELLRIKYFGKKGILTAYFQKLADLPKENKPKIGALINTIKNKLEKDLHSKKNALKNQNLYKIMDITLPEYPIAVGKYHPITQVINEIKTIFKGLNFYIAEGPEIETEYYNFEALNTPKYHPARDLQSTFYVDKKNLLRTQTSAVQIRFMEKEKPPLRIISIGKCYRSDHLDTSHSPMFHQIEGLVVDNNITFADLKGILKVFLIQMFGKNISIRLNPSYFPFTEPSVEVAFSCVICNGSGCSVCKNSGWLEVFGAGMVHPNVFKHVNIDSEKWTGFAFGGGIERLTMIKYHINDIRLFFENELKFLNQF